MAQAIWTGSISFGLVSVPVRMVSATSNQDVKFHQLDPDSGSRIRYRRVAEATGEEVSHDRIQRGFEVEPGKYVVVKADEFGSLAPKASREIDIEDFVDLAEIDPIYFEQPYYLVPDRESVKAYALLVETMTDQEKVAIGRFVMRSKERLVAIRAVDGLLCIETMRYADEVIDPADVEGRPSDDVTITKKERTMAKQLVDSLATEFEPEKYHDEYREQLVGLIEKKAKGEDIVVDPVSPEPSKVVDIMEALQESLERTKRRRAKTEPKKRSRRTA